MAYFGRPAAPVRKHATIGRLVSRTIPAILPVTLLLFWGSVGVSAAAGGQLPATGLVPASPTTLPLTKKPMPRPSVGAPRAPTSTPAPPARPLTVTATPVPTTPTGLPSATPSQRPPASTATVMPSSPPATAIPTPIATAGATPPGTVIATATISPTATVTPSPTPLVPLEGVPTPMIGEFSVSQSQMTLQLAGGTPGNEPPSVTRVHIRSNADLGFRLILVPGSARGLDSAADLRANAARQLKTSVRTWQAGTETAVSAEPLDVGLHGIVLRDTHSPMSLSEPVDVLVEFIVQDNFSVDAGEYRQDYQFVFEPRYSRATATKVTQ